MFNTDYRDLGAVIVLVKKHKWKNVLIAKHGDVYNVHHVQRVDRYVESEVVWKNAPLPERDYVEYDGSYYVFDRKESWDMIEKAKAGNVYAIELLARQVRSTKPATLPAGAEVAYKLTQKCRPQLHSYTANMLVAKYMV